MAKVMGYKGLLYYGAKGSTASTQITQRVDVTYNVEVETGSTTAAGDGSSVPIQTGEAVSLNGTISFNMIVADDSTAIVALMAAATTGDPIALRFIRASGLLGFDADCVIRATQGAPLNGEATVDFEVVALSASLRDPVLNG